MQQIIQRTSTMMQSYQNKVRQLQLELSLEKGKSEMLEAEIVRLTSKKFTNDL